MYGKIYSKQDFLESERYTASDFEAKALAPGLVMLTYKALIEFLKTNEKGEEGGVQFGLSAGRIGR